MNNNLLLLALTMLTPGFLFAQGAAPTDRQKQELHALIDAYSEARAKQDTALLENILTTDVDQLVSSGEWRRGKAESMTGMSGSSVNNPGTRTLTVESVRLVNPECAIVDARYDIRNPEGVTRHMWSTFIAVHTGDRWKIAAIRNMLPTRQ